MGARPTMLEQSLERETIQARFPGGRTSMRRFARTWPAYLLLLTAASLACREGHVPPTPVDQKVPKTESSPQAKSVSASFALTKDDERFEKLRHRMVEFQLKARDITDEWVLDAMGHVPRDRFVPELYRELAYADRPVPIGQGQTISQPYIVALMTQLVAPKPSYRALDIGTGSGYQAAVLAELVREVYTIEILQPLADESRQRLETLGYRNIEVRCGDGYQGWPEHAPFDVIVVAAAPDHIPAPLVEQLAPGGRMVIPVGKEYQELLLIEKDSSGQVHQRSIIPVAFVPMTGEADK